jgi:hypothetical protein
MPENESTLTLDPSDDGFVLHRTTSDGKTESLFLSDIDVLSLAQSAPVFRERILAKRNPTGGGVSAVYSTPVVQVGLAPSALGENVLLTMVAPSGAQVSFELPPNIVQILIDRLPAHLAKALAAKPATRQ